MSNIWIVAASLVIALSINFFMLDGWVGNYVKTSVLEAGESINTSNVYLKNSEGSIKVVSNKNMKSVEELSLSLVYNPENTTIGEIFSTTLPSQITNISNEDGLNTLLIKLDTTSDIKAGQEILILEVNKAEIRTENLNVINANFTDSSGEKYILSTSWIIF